MRRRPAARLLALSVGVAALAGLAVVVAGGDDKNRQRFSRHVARSSRPAFPRGPRVMTLGYSAKHRAIRIVVLGDSHARHPVLVVGCVHGNETAGIAVARRLAAGPPLGGTALWLISDLNPDGVAAGTRQNARGVDLNRNFPYGWRAQFSPGDPQYGGPSPLSEPESQLVYKLILRLAPRLTIWFHQPLGLTDQSGGDARVERRFALLSGLPLRELKRYPGSVTTWQDHVFKGSTAFVVELPPGRPSRAALTRYVAAVRRLADETANAGA